MKSAAQHIAAMTTTLIARVAFFDETLVLGTPRLAAPDPRSVMDRLSEFHSVCAAVGPAVPPARLPLPQLFTVAAATAARGIDHVRRLVSDALRTQRDPVELTLLERDALAFIQRCQLDLEQLQRYSERFARSPMGRAVPCRATHQRGVVVVLYAKLDGLVAEVSKLAHHGLTAPAVQPPPLEGSPTDSDDDARDADAADVGSTAAEAAAASTVRQRRPLEGDSSSSSAASAAAPLPGASHGPSQSLAVPFQTATTSVEETSVIESRMEEISAMIGLISGKLVEQQHDVDDIGAMAEEAHAYVRQGNAELKQAEERPNLMRDFVVLIMVIFAALLWFLDWQTS